MDRVYEKVQNNYEKVKKIKQSHNPKKMRPKFINVQN